VSLKIQAGNEKEHCQKPKRRLANRTPPSQISKSLQEHNKHAANSTKRTVPRNAGLRLWRFTSQ
jgi:hypothetical protein